MLKVPETSNLLHRGRSPALRLQSMQQHRRARSERPVDNTHRGFAPGETKACCDLTYAEQPKMLDNNTPRQQSPDPKPALRHQLGTRAVLG